MSAQLVSIIVMFISGIAVAAVIDGTRIILAYMPFRTFRYLAQFIEWLVWTFLAIGTFYLLFLIKGGHWRLVDPLAQILGIISYELYLQKIVRFIGRVFVAIFIKPIYYIVRLFVNLVRNIIKFIIKICFLLVNPIFKFLKKYLLNPFKS